MGLLIGLITVLGLAAGALAVFKSVKFNRDQYGNLKGVNVNALPLAVWVVAFVALQFGLSALGTVPAGHRGVVTKFGAVTGKTLEPGLYFLNPVTDKVELMDVQLHAYKSTAAAASRDLQNVSTEVTLNFQLDPSHAAQMYNEMRRDYGERIIVPGVQEAVKAITAKYDAEQLVTKREEVRNGIEEALSSRLARHGVRLDQISITNFAFSKDFAEAIEAKQVATQRALKAENEVREAKFKADAAIAEARGQAEAIRIQAEAIRSQGGAAYVQLKAIERWQGEVPQYMMGNAVPFINLGGIK